MQTEATHQLGCGLLSLSGEGVAKRLHFSGQVSADRRIGTSTRQRAGIDDVIDCVFAVVLFGKPETR